MRQESGPHGLLPASLPGGSAQASLPNTAPPRLGPAGLLRRSPTPRGGLGHSGVRVSLLHALHRRGRLRLQTQPRARNRTEKPTCLSFLFLLLACTVPSMQAKGDNPPCRWDSRCCCFPSARGGGGGGVDGRGGALPRQPRPRPPVRAASGGPGGGWSPTATAQRFPPRRLQRLPDAFSFPPDPQSSLCPDC